MKMFHINDGVKISSELTQYSANKHWIGKVGKIVKILGEYVYLVKWEHLNDPIVQHADFIESI